MSVISSRQHPIVQTFRRVETGDDRLALLDGWHLLTDAAHAGACRDGRDCGRPAGRLRGWGFERLTGHGTTVVRVTSNVMDALSPVRTPSGVAAIVARLPVELEQLLRPYPPLILVAVDLQDPGNVGAIVRAAEAGGASGVMVAGASADPWGWKALRAAMGSTFRLPVIDAGSDRCRPSLRRTGVRVVATAPREAPISTRLT